MGKIRIYVFSIHVNILVVYDVLKGKAKRDSFICRRKVLKKQITSYHYISLVNYKIES